MATTTIDELNIHIRSHSDLVDVKLSGRLVIENINRLQPLLHSEIKKNPNVLALNFNQIEQIDSSTIGFFVKLLHSSVNNDVELVFYDFNPSILQLFLVAKLDKFFSIHTLQEFQNKYLLSRKSMPV